MGPRGAASVRSKDLKGDEVGNVCNLIAELHELGECKACTCAFFCDLRTVCREAAGLPTR